MHVESFILKRQSSASKHCVEAYFWRKWIRTVYSNEFLKYSLDYCLLLNELAEFIYHTVGWFSVSPFSSVRNLDFRFDSKLHVNQIFSICFYALRRLRSIDLSQLCLPVCPSLPPSVSLSFFLLWNLSPADQSCQRKIAAIVFYSQHQF